MHQPNAPVGIARFGAFEVDLQVGELHKHGAKVNIQEQPFQVLAMLLARRGKVVSREELRHELSRDEPFVDFDNRLSTAVSKLREALGDSTHNPRFIETLPGRGYRFIGLVHGLEQTSSAVAQSK